MIKKSIIIVFAFIALGACKTSNLKIKEECDRLSIAIKSKEFIDFYNICSIKGSDIPLYDSTTFFLHCPEIPISCNKTIKVQSLDFDYDVNSPKIENISRIVLYNFEKSNSKYQFRFLDTQSNATLLLIYNSNNQLVDLEKGAF